MQAVRPRHLTRLLAAVGGVALIAAACSSGGASTADRPKPTTPPPLLTFTPAAQATNVGLTQIASVAVQRGHITSVTLNSAHGPVAGTVASGGSAWRSQGLLAPSTVYNGTVTVADIKGHDVTTPWSFTTVTPTSVLHTTMTSVGNGDTYGVGMPIVLQLNHDIPATLHKALEQRLSVTSTPRVVGAWHWFSDSELHWRPSTYWPVGTKATLKVNFAGFDLGNGVWGVDGKTVNFNIGASHISVVDANTHEMTVTNNGAVVATYPVSTGRDKYPTKAGIHVVNEKDQDVLMDSATVGIPRDSPDGYYEHVYWDVRISNSGEFVHAAPWSVGDQGSTNVSHGCVNMSTQNATSFYSFTQVGDVVQVINTPDQLEPDNGYGDWQLPWAQWPN